ncbi:Pentatricopeptide repeat-containing protein [Zostera marina]|uniref:Pentatricopeptide repeat-containing protein n=1 Tax=Zostera marina TaxID=29655 RepID=A0A0K9NU36_ZOSMR|nr:Pentatricopeptide repeat-containing protein [Zostera marina]
MNYFHCCHRNTINSITIPKSKQNPTPNFSHFPPLPSQLLPLRPTNHFFPRKLGFTCSALSVHDTKKATLSSEPIENEFIRYLNLSPKELTLVLKNQKHWRKTLAIFNFLRSQSLTDYTPNPIHYNVVLRAVGRAREWDELRICWVDMARDGVLPTNNTYAILIDVYDKGGLRKEALLWIKHMTARNMVPDEVTMNTVVRILKDLRKFEQAEMFFKGWCQGNVDLDAILKNNASSNNGDESEMSSGFSPKHFILTELFKSGGRPTRSAIMDTNINQDVGLGGNKSRKPKIPATYNTLIDMYGKAGKLKEASDTLAEMLNSGVEPDATTFNTMMHICGTNSNLYEAEALLIKMGERRIIPDTKTFNILMTLYAKAGNIEKMMVFYRKIRDSGLKPDRVTNRLIFKELCARNMVEEVELVIREMMSFNVKLEQQSLPVIVKMYVGCGLIEQSKLFLEKHCFVRRDECISSSNYAAIMDVYADKGLWMESERVFFRERDTKKDLVEYNVMIKAYGKAKLYDKAVSVYETMTSSGHWPDRCTYNSLIQMLSGANMLDKTRTLVVDMKSAGFTPRHETFSAFIACLARAGIISEAMDVYREMKIVGVQPNEVVYGSLINAFAEMGEVEEALHCLQKMEDECGESNQIAITPLIKAYRKLGCWQKAQELYAKLKENSIDGPDTIASNTMIHLYADLGMICEAQMIFEHLRQKGRADGISYATMMHLYKTMGMLDEAIQVSQEMLQRKELLTDCTSFTIAMSSCAANGQLHECGQLLEQMQMRRILPDVSTFNVIFDVLRKGGTPYETIQQFQTSYTDGKPYARQAIITYLFSAVGIYEVALKSCEAFVTAGITLDMSAYNAAIYTYGQSGKIDKALSLLMRMQEDGFEADIVTYINLALCYGKSGLVEGVRRIYSKLKYGEIEPNESLFKAVIRGYRDVGKPDLADLVDQEMRFSLKLQQEEEEEEEEISNT